jgi:IS30 family transposase
MGRYYEQLSLEERCAISTLSREGKSIRQIAAIVARAPSTVAREMRRTTSKTKGYEPAYAQQQTAGRRWRGSRLERQPALRSTVLDRLAMGWSPQQVAIHLAQAQGGKIISYESIYRFIAAQITRTKVYGWRHYLPRAKSKRGRPRREKSSSAMWIKERVSIHARPPEASRLGHWEADLMLFSAYGDTLLVLQERYSRLVLLAKLMTKSAHTTAFSMTQLLSQVPTPLLKSMTFDNGSEFAEHYRLHVLGMSTYFCDVRSPWQKGGIENAIGRLRRLLPRKTALSQWQEDDIQKVALLYNHTPRKCLNYKTPADVFTQQLLHFKCEFTSPLPRG